MVIVTIPFTTKSENLRRAGDYVKKFCVLPQYCFTVSELLADPNGIRMQIDKMFSCPLIVRSSALSEDSGISSQAGKFLSITNVNQEQVIAAALKVKDSFDDNNPNNQIFVQPALSDITLSGVMFTVDPNTGGNYYVINYDEAGNSNSVTSGEGRDLQTCYIFHGYSSGDERLDRLIDAANELIELFGAKNIDIEFAFDSEMRLYLLQVRQLILTKPIANYDTQKKALEQVSEYISKEMRSKPYVAGKRTIYSVMSDWNPAEMIGLRPRPLAMSLYKKLITDGTWAYQRFDYGYKDLRSYPLMLDFKGLTYIDARVSFNSFVPNNLENKLTARLVDYYLDNLAMQPDKHDKVEFDIIFSCYTLDLPERIKVLKNHGFTELEQQTLKQALLALTNNIINTKDGLWITDSKKIDILKDRYHTVMKSEMDIVSKMYWLLEDATRYGTLPFAGLARAGFVAVQMLRSLVTIGILSEDNYQDYLGDLNTISSQMASDHAELSRAAFLKKYGHLRPGTYEITSPCYKNAPDLYLGTDITANIPMEVREPKFSLTLEQYEAIQNEMLSQELDGDVLALFKFIKAGIEGREYAKFIFSRNVSSALELLTELGDKYNISRDDLSYVDYSAMLKLYSASDDPSEVLNTSIAYGKQKHAQALTYTMPPTITSEMDVFAFSLPSGQPNYITLGNATGDVCTQLTDRHSLKDKILLIPAADPGYDWIFSCNIKGFITAYGGANSHMAIRACELGIPAIIGAGEKMFDLWSRAKSLHMDCANKRVEMLS